MSMHISQLRRPIFFIVGAPKCGTTGLFTYLSQHPEIYMPEKTKEPNFFGRDLQFTYPRITLDKYLSLFSEIKNEKSAGEATVWYLYSKLAAKEIKHFCSSAKIIIMLRNPVDMLHSLHSQLLFDGNEDIEDFEEAIESEEQRKKGLRIPSSCVFPAALQYRQYGRYTDHVRRYLDVFGEDNVKIIIYDDFKNDVDKSYRETLHFLNVDESFQAVFNVMNANKQARSRKLHFFLWNTPNIAKALARALMPKSLRSRLRDKLSRANVKFVEREAMSLDLRKTLQEDFAPDVERLSELLKRDLTHWSKR